MRRALQLGSVFAIGCGLLTASAAAAPNTGSSGQGVLLMPSQPIERQVDAHQRRRVSQQLAELHFGPSGRVISPENLQILLGEDLPESPENHAYELDDVAIEVRASYGVSERPPHAEIPLGLAGLAWGVCHPSQAWRLLLPVMAG
jgi:hypothetical protein